MQLTLWTYEGPPHVGAMRIATAMRRRALRAARAAGRHLRRPAVHHDRAAATRPPVTYTTFQARDLGGDTAELFKNAARDAYERFQPAGDAGRRVLHRGADPGRSRRPGARAGLADPGGGAGTAGLSAKGELGRGGDVLPAGARLRRPARAAARHAAPRRRTPAALQSARPDRARASAIATMCARSLALLGAPRHRR